MADAKERLARALLAKDPSWEYGSILPIATRKGEIAAAIPDILRTPMNSWVDLMDSMGSGQLSTQEGTEEALPDVLNVAPMSGSVIRGSNAVRRGALSDEVKAAPYPIARAYGEIAELLDPWINRRPAKTSRPPPRQMPEVQPPRSPPNSGPTGPGVFRPPQRPAPNVNELLGEIETLTRQIGDLDQGIKRNADDLSQFQYSRNREHLNQNPGSLKRRLQRGPIYRGQRPPDGDDMVQVRQAMGQFHATMKPHVAAFRAGQLPQADLDKLTLDAAKAAGDARRVDPRYLLQQLDKQSRRSPKRHHRSRAGWQNIYPDKDK